MTVSEGEIEPKTKKELLRDRIISQETAVGTFIGSLVGAVPGFLLYGMLLGGGAHPMISMFVPGLFVGFGARILGRGILSIHGHIAGLVVLVCLIGFWWYAGATVIAIAFSVPNIIIAMLLAPRHLNREQGAAVYDYRIGRWTPD